MRLILSLTCFVLLLLPMTRNSFALDISKVHSKILYKKTKLLTTLPSSSTRFVLSKDGQKVAYIGTEKDKQFVVINGKKSKKYDEVRDLVWSPTGFKLGYSARVGDQWFSVIDRKEGKKYSFVGPVDFSWDGKKSIYRASVDGKDGWISESFVVINKKEIPIVTEKVTEVLLSPDGETWAFIKKSDSGLLLYLINGQTQKEYDFVGELKFNPAKSGFAYLAREGKKSRIVTDQGEGNLYDKINSYTFSPEGRLVYSVSDRNKNFYVIDGIEQKKYDQVGLVYFSKKGDLISYRARRGNTWYPVINGQEIDALKTMIWDPVLLSDDGQDYAYIPVEKDGYRIVLGRKRGPHLSDWDRIEWKVTDGTVRWIGFGHDGRVFNYSVQSLDKQKEYTTLRYQDGTKWKSQDYDAIGGGGHSLDELPYPIHNVFKAVRNGKNFVVVDKREGKEYDEIITRDFLFDCDFDKGPVRCLRATYNARNGNEIWRVVEDLKSK